jgi:D-threo-aldose 1-dehydrogenase
MGIDPTEQVQIGETGVAVSRLGLGGAPLGGMVLAAGAFRGSDREGALAIIQRAYELGIRYFDTAPLYGEGRSELRYGEILPLLPRADFALSTKVGRLLLPRGGGDEALQVEFDYGRDGVLRSLAASLERLQLARIDVLYVHDSDFVGEVDEATFAGALEVLAELRDDGVVGAIGMGMNQCEVTARLVARFSLDLVLLAGRYTLLDQAALQELLPVCVERGTRVAIGGPFNSGILARDLTRPVSFDYQVAPPGVVARARSIQAICQRHDVDMRAAALQFVAAHPAVATVVPGPASIDELETNVRLMQTEIPSALWAELKAAGHLAGDAPTPAGL